MGSLQVQKCIFFFFIISKGTLSIIFLVQSHDILNEFDLVGRDNNNSKSNLQKMYIFGALKA